MASPPVGQARRRSRRVDDLGDLLPAARSLRGYLWAGPNSLVGLVGGLSTRRRPVRWRGVLLFEDAGGALARFLRWRGFAAITLGHVIVANPFERAASRAAAATAAAVEERGRRAGGR